MDYIFSVDCNKMCPCLHYQIVLCGVFICSAGAKVTLTSLSKENNEVSYVCGSTETLICTTAPSVASMAWQIDSTQAAYCVGTFCNVGLAYAADYTFTFNVSAGIFLMKKKTVTLSDNGTKFTCDDGSLSADDVALVKVLDDYEYTNETEVDISASTKHIKHKVETSCLKLATADSVRFKWFYKKVNSSVDRHAYNTCNVSSMQLVETKNESVCISDPDCGAIGFTKKSSILIITEDEVGDTYQFEVDIDFGNRTQNVKFETAITLYVSTDIVGECPYGWLDVCIASVIFSAAVLVYFLLLSCMIYFADIDSSTKRYYIGIICGVAFISTCIALVVVCCKKGSKEETNDGISDKCITGSSEETCGISDGCVTGIAITVVDSVVLVIDIFMLCYKKTIANKR